MMGFQFHVVGDRDEDGLPLSTNDRTVLLSIGQLGVGVGIAQKLGNQLHPRENVFLGYSYALNGWVQSILTVSWMLFVTSHKELLKWHL